MEDPNQEKNEAAEVPLEEQSASEPHTAEPSTTQVPGAEPSATEVPADEPSATQVPAAEPSATEFPADELSATQVTVDGPSATRVPEDELITTQIPTAEPSAVEAPSAEPSAVQAPSAEKSAVQAPSAEKSAVQAPSAGTSTIHAPTAEPSALEAPTDKPTIDLETTKEPLALEDKLINSSAVLLEDEDDGGEEMDKELSESLAKEEQRVFTELEKEFLGGLRMSDSEYREFLNPYLDRRGSLTSWSNELRGLVANRLRDDRMLDLIIIAFLEERNFIIVYNEGTKEHEKMMNLLSALQEPFRLISERVLMSSKDNAEFWKALIEYYPPPFVLYGPKIYSTFEELEELLYQKLIRQPPTPPEAKDMAENEFHVVIIGGSSAGFAAAIRSSKYRDRVALIDVPSQNYAKGIKTAKKVMHSCARTLDYIRLGCRYGYERTAEKRISWSDLVEQCTDLKKRNDFKIKVALRKAGVTFITAKAKFTSELDLDLIPIPGTPKLSNWESSWLTGECYIIATGSRLKIPTDIIGASEHCATISDLLDRKTPPGKSLIIGNSSEALEWAGILVACDFEVTIITNGDMINSLQYEDEFVMRIRKHMEVEGIRFIDGCRVLRVSPSGSGSGFRRTVEGLYDDGTAYVEDFDTVILDGIMVPCTSHMGLTRAGIRVNKDRYIKADWSDRTSRKNVYALGDVAEGRPLSIEVAEKSAKYLIDRLFKFGNKKLLHGMVPRVILTPLEYGYIGFSEYLAKTFIKLKIRSFRKIYVYETRFDPTEDLFYSDSSHLKLLVRDDEQGFRKIIGFHLLGDNIGETLQGIYTLMQNYNYVERFDKVLSTFMDLRILKNVVLTKTYSWPYNVEAPLSVKDVDNASKERPEFIQATHDASETRSEPGKGQIDEYMEDKASAKNNSELKAEETTQSSSKSIISKAIPEDELYSFSESSSCESLHSDFETLKDKSEFLEMSFENEKIAQDSLQNSDSSSESSTS